MADLRFNLPKKSPGSGLKGLASLLYSGDGSAGVRYLQDQLIRNDLGEDYDEITADPELFKLYLEESEPDLEASLNAYTDALTSNPFGRKVAVEGGGNVNALGTNLGALGAQIKAHPLKAGLGAITTGSNISGLFDNDKVFGQIGGLVGGSVLGNALFKDSPYNKYLVASAGGMLGSLFDKLMAKRDAERQVAAQPANMQYRR